MNGDSPCAQTICHQGSRPLFRKCKLGVAMDIVPNAAHLGGPGRHRLGQRAIHVLLDGEIGRDL
jgi:hypothetical protein